MERRYALFLAFAITGVIFGNWLFFQDFEELEKVVIVRALDGDTVELEDGRRIRLLNINAPEKGHAFYTLSHEYLIGLEGEVVSLDVAGTDVYGRILGRIYDEDYINLYLVEEGLVHAYLVDDSERGSFEEAQENAINGEKGIWAKSDYNNCLSVEINKKEEFVVIEDSCGVNFEGWTLKDESTRDYEFEGIREDTVILYSGKGDDLGNELYWGRGKAWNDDGDSIFIRDDQGLLVYYDHYS